MPAAGAQHEASERGEKGTPPARNRRADLYLIIHRNSLSLARPRSSAALNVSRRKGAARAHYQPSSECVHCTLQGAESGKIAEDRRRSSRAPDRKESARTAGQRRKRKPFRSPILCRYITARALDGVLIIFYASVQGT